MALDPTQRYITSLIGNNDILVVGMADYRVEIFDLHSMDHKKTISEGLWEVKSVYLDSDYIYVSSLNESVAIYDISNFHLVSRLEHPLGVLKMWSNEDYIYTTSYNREVWIWDKHSFEYLNRLHGHSVRTNCVTSTSNYIYTGDGFTLPKASIKIWDKNTHALIQTINYPPAKRVNEIRIVDDMLFSGHGSPGEIRIRDLHSHEIIEVLQTYSDCTSLSINHAYIAAAAKDSVLVWDRNYKFVEQLQENNREVSSLILHGDQVIYGSRNTLKIYNLATETYSFEHDL